jgi:L-lactate dehydrogenase complex protein LldE
MKVSLFIPCIVDNFLTGIAESTAQVLERSGLELDYPQGQTCCGQPGFNAGHWDDARKVARQFLRAFADSEVIVSPSGSCVSMVRNHYEKLFEGHDKDLALARDIGKRTFELTEFLVDKLGITDLGASYDGKVTYHDSCHLNRELGIREQPRTLIKNVKGIELIEMEDPERCCGFGGTFSVKLPEVSAAMARKKAEKIKESGADAVIVCDPGCYLQIDGYLKKNCVNVKVMHIAELISG